MTTEWTSVLVAAVAGGSAVLAGLIGHWSASRQSDVELARIRAENERLREDRREAHFQRRQAIYHEYLDIAHEFHVEASNRRIKHPEFVAWTKSFEHHTSAVQLFGTDKAKEAVQNLESLVDDLIIAARQRKLAEWRPWRRRVARNLYLVYIPREDEWIETYRAVVEAMREDVRPN